MSQKQIVCQKQIAANNAAGIACLIIAAASVFAAFVVASAVAGPRYSAIEWIFDYFDLYCWFFIGAAIFFGIGMVLVKRKGGWLTVTDSYVSLSYTQGITALPINTLTSVRCADKVATITTANCSIQAVLPSATDAVEIVNAILSQTK